MNTKQLKNYIGIQVKQRRKDLGLSQDDIAKFLSLCRVSVFNIEEGRHMCTLINMIKLCQLFACSLTDLLPPFEPVVYTIETKEIIVKRKSKIKKIKRVE
jgi:DNA-binding XRE family transcriptional regulator